MTKQIIQLNGVEQFQADRCAQAGFGGIWNFETDAPPPPVGCVPDAARTRMATVIAGYNGGRNFPQRTADATSLLNVFGWDAAANKPTDPTLFPYGVNGIGVVLNILRGKYLSFGFRTPSSYFKTGKWQGTLAFESNLSQKNGNPKYNVAISSQCNDYADHALFVGKNPNGSLDVVSDGQPHMKFTQGLQANDMQPNTNYFLNIRFADLTNFWPMCFMTWRMSSMP